MLQAILGIVAGIATGTISSRFLMLLTLKEIVDI